MVLNDKTRYLQIAFNYDIGMVRTILPKIPASPRIIIEAGTPFIKREGVNGIRYIRRIWKGMIVADIKIADGAEDEVRMVYTAGANAVTVLGSAPKETLSKAVNICKSFHIICMADMLGVKDPLGVLRKLSIRPDVVVLHLGRDEEQTRGKLIQYRHVNRIRSKYPVVISAAGGVDIKRARSAIFNGANIVVANIVQPGDGWRGISTEKDVGDMARKFLETIE